MRVRWKFWKRPVSPERLEELQRIVDEAEEGTLIPMKRAEIKAFTPREYLDTPEEQEEIQQLFRLNLPRLDAIMAREAIYGQIARRIRKELRHES